MNGIRAGPASGMMIIRMQPDEPQPPAMLDYALPPVASARRLRIAFLLALVEGFGAGALLIILARSMFVLLPLLSIGLPFHLGILARRYRIIIGLVFAASLAGAVAAGAVWIAVAFRLPYGRVELGWAVIYYARAFAVWLCIAGALSLIASVPLTLVAQRRERKSLADNCRAAPFRNV